MNDEPILNKIDSIRGKKFKRLGKTKYKYVYIVSFDNVETYRAELSKYKFCKCFDNMRDAAIAVDKKLLENNKEPVNILKRK